MNDVIFSVKFRDKAVAKAATWLLLLVAVSLLGGCANLYLRTMGARGFAVPMDKIPTLYYKTSPDLRKVYVFYRIPDRIVVGAGTSSGPGEGFLRSITIDFSAVRDSGGNREEFGEGVGSYHRENGERFMEFDMYGGNAHLPHDQQVRVFYGIERRDRNKPIPYRGTWSGRS